MQCAKQAVLATPGPSLAWQSLSLVVHSLITVIKGASLVKRPRHVQLATRRLQ